MNTKINYTTIISKKSREIETGTNEISVMAKKYQNSPTVPKTKNTTKNSNPDLTYENFEREHSLNLSDIVSDFTFEQEDNYSELGKNLNYLELLNSLYTNSDLETYQEEPVIEKEEYRW
tara:strand:+ start:129 stop:485 length:357 start_codon:yes stop_codon:yes gene_type:complete